MTPDSSVLVAAFSSWHDSHEAARAAVAGVLDLIAHVELETYSVLTRLPGDQRVDEQLAARYLTQFEGSRLELPRDARRRLVQRLADQRIAGGAVYDALIAATAAHHDEELVTCDRRALAVYARVGARVVTL